MDGKEPADGSGSGRRDWLVRQFEADRARLKNVAYRMLGSVNDAEDAVQESWVRLCGAEEIENPGTWLTTVVARICLDMLRTRKVRREEPLDQNASFISQAPDPEQEALLADSVGLALLVVMEKLNPAERIAFVLRDMFSLPFDQIARILGRSPDAARKLASRARHRVSGRTPGRAVLAQQRQVVDAFLAASRKGDLEALLKLLSPQVIFRADLDASMRIGGLRKISGAEDVARLYMGRARGAKTVLVDGRAGVVVGVAGRLLLALRIEVVEGRIASIEAIANRRELARMDFALAP